MTLQITSHQRSPAQGIRHQVGCPLLQKGQSNGVKEGVKEEIELTEKC